MSLLDLQKSKKFENLRQKIELKRIEYLQEPATTISSVERTNKPVLLIPLTEIHKMSMFSRQKSPVSKKPSPRVSTRHSGTARNFFTCAPSNEKLHAIWDLKFQKELDLTNFQRNKFELKISRNFHETVESSSTMTFPKKPRIERQRILLCILVMSGILRNLEFSSFPRIRQYRTDAMRAKLRNRYYTTTTEERRKIVDKNWNFLVALLRVWRSVHRIRKRRQNIIIVKNFLNFARKRLLVRVKVCESVSRLKKVREVLKRFCTQKEERVAELTVKWRVLEERFLKSFADIQHSSSSRVWQLKRAADSEVERILRIQYYKKVSEFSRDEAKWNVQVKDRMKNQVDLIKFLTGFGGERKVNNPRFELPSPPSLSYWELSDQRILSLIKKQRT